MKRLDISPTPWKVIDWSQGDNFDMYVADQYGRTVCNVISHFESDEDLAKANANLIANAPDLLEALELLLPHACMHIEAVSGDTSKDKVIQFCKEVLKQTAFKPLKH